DVSGAANDSATSASTTTAVGTKTGARMEVRRPGGVSPGGVGSGGIMAALQGRPVAAGNSSRTQSRRRESRRATSPPKAAGVVAAGPLLQTRASRYARRSTAGTPRRARAPRLYSAARAGPGRPAVEAPGEPRTPAPAQEAGPGNGPDTRPRPGCTRDGCARTAATDPRRPRHEPTGRKLPRSRHRHLLASGLRPRRRPRRDHRPG